MKLNLFNHNREKSGVEKNEDTTPTIPYYFKSLWRKGARLIAINLLAILQFIPLFVAFFSYFWADTTPTVADLSFPLLYGVNQLDPSPASHILFSISSPQFNIPVLSSSVVLTMVGMCILFAVLFGWWNVGFTYLMRELVNGRPVFIFSDLKLAIKKNAKQGFFMGVLDFLLLFVLGVNVYSMSVGTSDSFLGDFFYIANIAICIIYGIMRFYMYLMLVTFDMKLSKILKNALIFVMLGIKRNLLAILWIIALLALNFALFIVYTPLGIVLPILYIVAIPMFTTAYAAYPVIYRYMVVPALPKEDEAEQAEKESLFEDRPSLSADQLWEQFTATQDSEITEPYSSWSFGQDADALAQKVCSGKKSATSSAYPIYAAKGIELPHVGEYNIILDAKGRAVCITQTTKVYIVPFEKITDEHAALEGEGDGSLKQWKKMHKAFFTKELETVGIAFSDTTKIVCEQFTLVYKPE